MTGAADYISRLKMPAMITDREGNILSRSRTMVQILPEDITVLPERCRRYGAGSRFDTLITGTANRRTLVLSDGGTERWYIPKLLAGHSPVALPEGCAALILCCAGIAERTMLGDPRTSAARLFREAADGVFSRLFPACRAADGGLMTVRGFCRFLSLSARLLFGNDRVKFSAAIRQGLILSSPERAFSAAGEAIGSLYRFPGTVWQVFAENGAVVMTDGRCVCDAGGYFLLRSRTRMTDRGLNDTLAVTASAATEFAFF